LVTIDRKIIRNHAHQSIQQNLLFRFVWNKTPMKNGSLDGTRKQPESPQPIKARNELHGVGFNQPKTFAGPFGLDIYR